MHLEEVTIYTQPRAEKMKTVPPILTTIVYMKWVTGLIQENIFPLSIVTNQEPATNLRYLQSYRKESTNIASSDLIHCNHKICVVLLSSYTYKPITRIIGSSAIAEL